jgi:tRNA uridine 5-carboxymethylaminomethyl modification enzyme
VSKERWARFTTSDKELKDSLMIMESTSLSPEKWQKFGISVNSDGVMRSALDLLRWPNMNVESFHEIIPQLKHISPEIRRRIEIEGILLWSLIMLT